ncbi:uncharacterized protein ACNLHF_008065 [Anomaloglossus baeobatrachus]
MREVLETEVRGLDYGQCGSKISYRTEIVGRVIDRDVWQCRRVKRFVDERVGSAERNDIGHAGVLEHYHQLIVKHLSLTSPVYRRLKENGILTTEQIGLLELEESSDRKVARLLDVLKSKDHHMFTTFCAVLHETGHHHLAQVLQKAINNKTPMLPEEEKPLPEELQELEEKITIAKWERDLAIKEKNILHNENEALQNLNTELQALVRKLEETVLRSDLRDLRTYHSNVKDLGFSVDYLKEKSKRFYPETHLGLVYR